MHRSRKAATNTIFSFLEEIVSLICGFVLPRLILSNFGSDYNGLTTSISQFLACAVLLRAGIGGATKAALYKPLAEDDKDKINAIVKATDIFMKKVGIVLLCSIVAFASLYPFLVQNEFGWLFTFSLFIIIGISSFAESFFGITYLIVLQADQSLWISSLLKSICTLINTLLGALLIYLGASIHEVKLGSSIIFVAYPLVLGAYVKHRYKIDTHVKPDNIAIAQRWDAFWHQVALFVMNNTDVLVLTIFTNMFEVSVYSVYNLVMNGLKKTVQAFTNGLEAAFGNMIAKNEQIVLRNNVAVIETLLYGLSTVIYTSAAVLIIDFVKLYTSNVNDVNYIRPLFAYVIILAQFFNGIRMPYQAVVQAAGHYKQTKKGAIIEPIINIVLSLIFVVKYGLVGVAIGTLAATIFRTMQYSYYMSKHLVIRSWSIVFGRIIASIFEAGIAIELINLLNITTPTDYWSWALKGIIVVCVSTTIVFVGSILFFNKDTVRLLHKIKNIFVK